MIQAEIILALDTLDFMRALHFFLVATPAFHVSCPAMAQTKEQSHQDEVMQPVNMLHK